MSDDVKLVTWRAAVYPPEGGDPQVVDAQTPVGFVGETVRYTSWGGRPAYTARLIVDGWDGDVPRWHEYE